MAAHRLGQVEAYVTVREVLSEASTAADGVLSRERSGFYRCRYATLGLNQLLTSNRIQLYPEHREKTDSTVFLRSAI